jgi:hypothetical protein
MAEDEIAHHRIAPVQSLISRASAPIGIGFA